MLSALFALLGECAGLFFRIFVMCDLTKKMEVNMSEQRYRTVAYVRVSTTDQTTSLESQIRHFNEVMDTTPHLVNCGIYVDNGISGRYLNRREGFLQMLTDCELGLVDRILCKSIKRFGRNTLDIVRAIARLTELNISVYFEQENSPFS